MRAVAGWAAAAALLLGTAPAEVGREAAMRRTVLQLRMPARVFALLVFCSIVTGSACAYRARSTQPKAPSKAQLSELWDATAVGQRRDLFNGPGGAASAPVGSRFIHIETDTKGASPGYKVRDDRGRIWDVKLGPEAPVEVVVSRLLWAAGFHQLPAYFLGRWTLEGGPRPGPQAAGRFRPMLRELRPIDRWAWHENPFVGTRELRGLFVLMVVVNNWDLKTSQNSVFERRGGPRVKREYMVVDVGASLGGTRWFFPGSKGDLEDYERQPMIAGVRDGIVQFHYRGAWREPWLDNTITVADVQWACGLLHQLTDKRLADAFRAGGYDARLTARFVRIVRARVGEGLQLSSSRRAERQ